MTFSFDNLYIKTTNTPYDCYGYFGDDIDDINEQMLDHAKPSKLVSALYDGDEDCILYYAGNPLISEGYKAFYKLDENDLAELKNNFHGYRFRCTLELDPRKTYTGFVVKDEHAIKFRECLNNDCCHRLIEPYKIKVSSDRHHIIEFNNNEISIFDEENYTLLIKDE